MNAGHDDVVVAGKCAAHEGPIGFLVEYLELPPLYDAGPIV